jgi:hypothetical protein
VQDTSFFFRGGVYRFSKELKSPRSEIETGLNVSSVDILDLVIRPTTQTFVNMPNPQRADTYPGSTPAPLLSPQVDEGHDA